MISTLLHRGQQILYSIFRCCRGFTHYGQQMFILFSGAVEVAHLDLFDQEEKVNERPYRIRNGHVNKEGYHEAVHKCMQGEHDGKVDLSKRDNQTLFEVRRRNNWRGVDSLYHGWLMANYSEVAPLFEINKFEQKFPNWRSERVPFDVVIPDVTSKRSVGDEEVGTKTSSFPQFRKKRVRFDAAVPDVVSRRSVECDSGSNSIPGCSSVQKDVDENVIIESNVLLKQHSVSEAITIEETDDDFRDDAITTKNGKRKLSTVYATKYATTINTSNVEKGTPLMLDSPPRSPKTAQFIDLMKGFSVVHAPRRLDHVVAPVTSKGSSPHKDSEVDIKVERGERFVQKYDVSVTVIIDDTDDEEMESSIRQPEKVTLVKPVVTEESCVGDVSSHEDAKGVNDGNIKTEAGDYFVQRYDVVGTITIGDTDEDDDDDVLSGQHM